MIKSIGDSVLFVHQDPIAAYEIAEGIHVRVARKALATVIKRDLSGMGKWLFVGAMVLLAMWIYFALKLLLLI